MTFDFTTIDWKVILAALAFVVALITLIYFQRWRNRKRLSYEILSNVELISADKLRDEVEIRYHDQPVENVQLLVVKLINDGYQPIKKDEFEKPIKFMFPHAKILTAGPETFHPENIGTQITHEDDWLEIAPNLFNRKDYVQFKVLLTGYSRMEIDARIVGVSNVRRSRKRANIRIGTIGFLGGIVTPMLVLTFVTGNAAFAQVSLAVTVAAFVTGIIVWNKE